MNKFMKLLLVVLVCTASVRAQNLNPVFFTTTPVNPVISVFTSAVANPVLAFANGFPSANIIDASNTTCGGYDAASSGAVFGYVVFTFSGYTAFTVAQVLLYTDAVGGGTAATAPTQANGAFTVTWGAATPGLAATCATTTPLSGTVLSATFTCTAAANNPGTGLVLSTGGIIITSAWHVCSIWILSADAQFITTTTSTTTTTTATTTKATTKGAKHARTDLAMTAAVAVATFAAAVSRY